MANPFATEAKRLSNVVKQELWSETGYTRAVVTVNEAAAKSYVPGTVLGKVTSGGKYKIAVQTSVDGSQTADAFNLNHFVTQTRARWNIDFRGFISLLEFF